ncbi:M28 family peptidase [Plectonema cf. radiosum LEGE 06105]|uniref:M28 family peptidase n=1 Tax=Plectonema cf. radiosum LEGE 06105 TaxID=945769 RepID=A0A8J7K310_9CYAN|nr:M28 family peptidase [Plectonema radiosum]MBE9213537.1 M28 family peptidase [Plectonema cf. radiosum LEGE 06105]
MKKNLIFIILIIVGVAVAILFGDKFFSQPEETAVINNIQIETPLPKKEPQTVAINPPQVDSQRLFANVQKLSFQRFTDAERRRTRDYITKELKKLGWEPALEEFPTGVNIFTEKQGRDRNAGSILIAAHYDTVLNSPGADDNASGVAVLLEIARLFGSSSTPRTLQLAFFDKEEAGLLGSRAFVNNPARLENLRGVVVLDMVGYACYTSGCQKSPSGLPITPISDKGDFLAVVGDTEHLPLINVFNNVENVENNINNSSKLPPVFTLPVPLKGVFTPDVLRSDHAPFWLQGIGALLVTDTANLRSYYYHQPSDTPANIERNFFTGAAQLIVNVTDSLLQGSGSLATPN